VWRGRRPSGERCMPCASRSRQPVLFGATSPRWNLTSPCAVQVVLCTALIGFAVYRITAKAQHIYETDQGFLRLARNLPRNSTEWSFGKFVQAKMSNLTRLSVFRPRGSGRLTTKPMQPPAGGSFMCDLDTLKLGVSCRCAEAPDVPARRVEGWGVPGWEHSHAANCARAQEAKDVDVVWFGDSITGARR